MPAAPNGQTLPTPRTVAPRLARIPERSTKRWRASRGGTAINITTTLDPISLNDAARNPNLHLRDGDLDIYFKSGENMDAYMTMHVERPGVDLAHSLDNPTEECGTEWN
ncbi:MAG: hypothetical protein QNK18_12870 [Gammaproteobacteria bacterium]|nr:hypothetical protein [Gammaproteobacteria bacterium]MDJ0892068.1 hypothetical protein [Gammaproteobacteria bacterium]